ncbi:hypothetical protein BT67DRAFT_152584 [Trichocladium antarcticum]|uniref:Uncharacterized protein n=1 Tax=Trichocladium antarcticum TaxID=1450529 RepID=A0AAN6ZBP8_9PEZI|nr:hypothetical protein BT67DRAFT_152584 [Trichocladium antarcticum]
MNSHQDKEVRRGALGASSTSCGSGAKVMAWFVSRGTESSIALNRLYAAVLLFVQAVDSAAQIHSCDSCRQHQDTYPGNSKTGPGTADASDLPVPRPHAHKACAEYNGVVSVHALCGRPACGTQPVACVVNLFFSGALCSKGQLSLSSKRCACAASYGYIGERPASRPRHELLNSAASVAAQAPV